MVVVVGSGIAGCATALGLARRGVRVVLVNAAHHPNASSTFWAQGGIVYKPAGQRLYEDILSAGYHKNDRRLVESIVKNGPSDIDSLLLDGFPVQFERDGGGALKLTMEAAHRERRIIYSGDCTGKYIAENMWTKVTLHPLIQCINDAFVFSLNMHQGECRGVRARLHATGVELDIESSATVLCTGGIGQIYARTSNPNGVDGTGIGAALRAGAKLRNMEMIQFHPTSLYSPAVHHDGQCLLITEALRGEGAFLLNHRGERFMKRYHDLLELAPRDVVARSIIREMALEGSPCMFLDARHLGTNMITKRFPYLFSKLLDNGINMARDRIPTIPCQHFMIGGIQTDIDARSTIPNLYAVGEVANNGFHGANRLASTSLLEGITVGNRLSRYLAASNADPPRVKLRQHHQSHAPTAANVLANVEERNKRSIQQLMTMYMGISRTRQGMTTCLKQLNDIQVSETMITPVTLQKAVAMEVTKAGLENRDSIGVHYVESGGTPDVNFKETSSNVM